MVHSQSEHEHNKVTLCNMEMYSKSPPFQRRDKIHLKGQQTKANILAFGFMLFPLRMAIIFLTLGVYWAYLRVVNFLFSIGLLGEKIREQCARAVAPHGARFLLYCCAIHTITRHYVTEKQLEEHRRKYSDSSNVTPVSPQESTEQIDRAVSDKFDKKDPFMIVSNHIAFFDPSIIVHEFGECSFVVKEALSRAPIVGVLLIQLKTLFAGKGGVVDEIKKRVEKYYLTSQKSKFLIYPEGTTTNGDYMLHFHDGAFLPGSPIQPVVTRYKFKNFSPGWVGDDWPYFKHLFSQLNNHLVIVHFPPYIPNQEERTNPKLFALNVRRAMAELSNIYAEKDCGPLQLSDVKFVRNYKPETK
jgi:1-acyl-sn-glycerol-3-phosphate acyltransferase